jgi:hypothetical protein
MPSSVIASHRYDPATGNLTIEFTSGRTYVYFPVPEDVAAAFGMAVSKGIFFNKRIRDHFRCREIDGRSGERLW